MNDALHKFNIDLRKPRDKWTALRIVDDLSDLLLYWWIDELGNGSAVGIRYATIEQQDTLTKNTSDHLINEHGGGTMDGYLSFALFISL